MFSGVIKKERWLELSLTQVLKRIAGIGLDKNLQQEFEIDKHQFDSM